MGVVTMTGRNGTPIPLQVRLRAAARWANRIRWRRKYLVTRAGEGDATRLQRWVFILGSAETDTFSYEVRNGPELAVDIARFLEVDQQSILEYLRELQEDRWLRTLITRRTRWRPKYRWSPPVGRHIIAYCITRGCRPPTVLELGVRHGLGSLVLLRALERNRTEGHPGELLSVDCDPTAGGLVPPGAPMRSYTGMTPDVLGELRPRAPIGFVISDTVPDPDVIRGEFDFALQYANRPIIFMQNHGWSLVLSELAERHHGTLAVIEERAADHVVSGRHVDLLRIGDLDVEI